MKLRTLIATFVVLWLTSAVAVAWWFAGNLQDANNFGGSFGAISSLFSGLALAMAVYSMVLQQKQGEEFENRTLAALQQQASAIKLIEISLLQQVATAKVAALTSLIDRDEQRIETLIEWGSKAGNENKYSKGIQAAKNRIDKYHEQLQEYAKT